MENKTAKPFDPERQSGETGANPGSGQARCPQCGKALRWAGVTPRTAMAIHRELGADGRERTIDRNVGGNDIYRCGNGHIYTAEKYRAALAQPTAPAASTPALHDKQRLEEKP